MPEVKRTLVKSVPELWAEVSDASALGRHLAPFGAVSVVGAEPERRIEWEGELARGEVLLEPSGFGTKVVLRAAVVPPSEPPDTTAPSEELEVAVARAGFWARLFRHRPPAPSEPAPEPPAAREPAAPSLTDEIATAALSEALDALGAAHHRPFSRS